MQISLDEVSRVLLTQPTTRLHMGGAYTSTVSSVEAPASKVEVSDEAKEIRRVTKLVNDLPDVREDRVQALKAQIESGSYNVTGEEIADLIIRRAVVDGFR